VVIARRLLITEVDRLFKVAQKLGWVKLYKFNRNGEELLGITEGDKLKEVFPSVIMA
jgi:hypothetical protein